MLLKNQDQHQFKLDSQMGQAIQQKEKTYLKKHFLLIWFDETLEVHQEFIHLHLLKSVTSEQSV